MIKTGWIAALAVGLALTMAQTDADARRLGGGKSTGMQRATPDRAPQGTPATPAAAPNNAAAPAAAAAPNAAAAAQGAARRSWMGPIAGLAAGLGLAALFSHLGMGEELANFMMLALLAVAAIFVVRWLMRRCVFPLGRVWRPAPDRLGHEIVRLACEPGDVRDRLTRHIFVSKDVRDPTGLLEVTLEKVIAAEPAERKLERAIRDGVVRRYHGIDWIGDAAAKFVLTAEEATLLREVEDLTARVIAVDHFDPAEVRPNYVSLGHNSKASQGLAAE